MMFAVQHGATDAFVERGHDLILQNRPRPPELDCLHAVPFP